MDTQLVRGAGNVHSWFSGGKGEKQEPGVVAGLPRPAPGSSLAAGAESTRHLLMKCLESLCRHSEARHTAHLLRARAGLGLEHLLSS